VQQLDLQLATTLRVYSHAHQREEAFRLLQQQTGLMPALIARLDTMTSNLEHLNQANSERLWDHQQAFHTRTEAHQAQWASTLEQWVRPGVTDGAQAIGAALAPIVAQAMASVSRENATMHATVTEALQRQLDGVSANLLATTTAAA